MPQSFIAFDKIERFGGKIADPFAVNIEAKQEIEARVFTSKHEQTEAKRAKAIKLIEASFANAKRVKVGMKKPGKPGVTAKRVLDIVPCFEAMPHRVLQVSNDEV